MTVRNAWLWTLAAMLFLAAASYGAFLWLTPEEPPEGILYGSGRIEATSVRVSAEVTGKVVESNLVEGRSLRADEVLVRVDDTDLRTRLRQAEAGARVAERTQARVDVELGTWRHHLETATADLERHRELRESGAVTREALDRAEDRFREAQGRVEGLEAQHAEAEANHEAARHDIDLQRSRLDKAVIVAPIDGTVLTKGVEVGELATPGRVVAELADLTYLELKIFVPAPDLARISLGDPARVRVDAFPDRHFEARVARVDRRAVFTPRDVYMPDERARIVHGVTLVVDGVEDNLHPGMPADAWIRWRSDAEWPDRLTVPR